MKITRLERILRLITILQSGRYYNPGELAQQLAVSRRTVFRDLDTLHKGGIPYYHDEEKGGYKIAANFFLPPLNLKLSEALALILVAHSAGSTNGLPLYQEAREAALKIENALPAYIQQECGQLLRTTSVYFAPHARHDRLEQITDLLRQAIQKRHKVQLSYDSFFEKKQIITTLSPYHLHFAQRAWYVIGYSSLHQSMRTFKLGRIKGIRLMPHRFVRDKSFRIENYLKDAWSIIPEDKSYQVKLLFSPMVAGNVAEVLWHRTQKHTWRDDGRLLFEVHVDGLREITWWILGYGDQVEVLEPEMLRRNIKQIAKNMLNTYE